MEIHQPEKRGRGRGRRERTPREDDYSSRPRDSIRLFEFLEPRIGTEEEEADETLSEELDDNDYTATGRGNQHSWGNDGISRPRRYLIT